MYFQFCRHSSSHVLTYVTALKYHIFYLPNSLKKGLPICYSIPIFGVKNRLKPSQLVACLKF